MIRELNKSGQVIRCAEILYEPFGAEEVTFFRLPLDYSSEELNLFLDSLDFEYDDDYGLQELFGCVYLTDGYWLERSEYDGSEWWTIKHYPEIPETLRRNND